jgi:hypothetical protein
MQTKVNLKKKMKWNTNKQFKGDKGYGHSCLIALVFVYACFSASSNLAI